jgi:hypothetical protein
MATYLQGVTDYIPDYQPFQPDLNFYANVLQTKQNQYDTNYKAINNLYGQLYNSDLTHGDNVKKKSELLKQIDFNLKRVSGLDLSLEQNVEQATQVFKPFYQDQYLMKDMAWTKNWNNTYTAAQSLQNNQDEKRRAEYWDIGIKDLQYRKEEFRNADLEKTLSIGNAQYTPDVKVSKLYGDLIDKADLSFVTNLPDASGMYMVKQKNGQLVLPSLQKLLISEYVSNSALQKRYATKAYVERNDYAVQNAEKFNGDKLAAEKDFLQQRYNYLSNIAAKQAKENKEAEKVVIKKTNSVENDIQEGNVNPMQGSYLERLNSALKVESANRQHSDKINETLNGESTTVTTSGQPAGSAGLDLSNMELARLKVDAATASREAETDIMNIAGIYATKGQSIEYSVNQVGLENLRHSHNLERDIIKQEYSKQNLAAKSLLDRENDRIKHYISTGYYEYDDKGGVKLNPIYAALGVEPGSAGTTTETTEDLKQYNQKVISEVTHEITNPFLGAWFNDISNLIGAGDISEKEVETMLNGGSKGIPFAGSEDSRDPYSLSNILPTGKKSGYQQFADLKASFDKDPVGTANAIVDNKQIKNIYNGFTKWVDINNAHGVSTRYNQSPDRIMMHKYIRSMDAFETIDKKNDNKIVERLSKIPILDSRFKGLTKDDMIYLSSQVLNRKSEEEFVKDAERLFSDKPIRKITVPTQSGGLSGVSLSSRTELEYTTKDYYKGLYKALNEEYTKVVTDPNPATGLTSVVPTIANKSGQAGFAANTGFKMVNTAIPATATTLSGLYNDINKIDWGQAGPYRISINGINKPVSNEDEYDREGTTLDVNVAKSLMIDLIGEIKPSSKLGPFKISQNQIAWEDKNIGAMTIYPPIDILKKNILNAEGKPDMPLIDKINKNGIAFIAPKENWNNNLFKQSQIGITEALLNIQGEVSYNHPNNAGNYTIKKETSVPGVDYNITYSLFGMDDKGNKIEFPQIPMQTRKGNRVDEAEDKIFAQLASVAAANIEQYKRFYQQNNFEAMKNAEKNFGVANLKRNWNY